MIKSYSIYNKETEEILRVITCSKEMLTEQLNVKEDFLEGSFSDVEYKVVNNQPILYTQEEKNLRQFPFIKNKIPHTLYKEMTDMELDEFLDHFFLGLMDITQWKIDHYSDLRKVFYPCYGDLLDAELKIRNEDDKIKVDGQKQKDLYDEQCWKVKERFKK